MWGVHMAEVWAQLRTSLSCPTYRDWVLFMAEQIGRNVNSIKVLLIERQSIVRAGLRLLLEAQSDLKVIGDGEERDEVVRIAGSEPPDIILLGLVRGEEDQLDIVPSLHAISPRARIILLGDTPDVEHHRRAVRLGVVGIVPKDQSPETLIKAVRKVYEGEVWLDRAMIARVLKEMVQQYAPKAEIDVVRIATLTEREHEIISLVGQGLSNRVIAERLHISDTTVRHHLTSIYGKLGCATRLELVVFAYAHALAASPSIPKFQVSI